MDVLDNATSVIAGVFMLLLGGFLIFNGILVTPNFWMFLGGLVSGIVGLLFFGSMKQLP